jgi:hypothetical protein
MLFSKLILSHRLSSLFLPLLLLGPAVVTVFGFRFLQFSVFFLLTANLGLVLRFLGIILFFPARYRFKPCYILHYKGFHQFQPQCCSEIVKTPA